jgi:DNA-binding NarL/FixJ family response regulator
VVKIRVLLVDDDALVRAGLRMILSSSEELEVVGEAADGADAVAAVQAHRPDVVLMDIRMPGMDGIAATSALRRLTAPPHVIVLTTFHADEQVMSALRAGADGFLLKDTPPTEIVTPCASLLQEKRCSPRRSPARCSPISATTRWPIAVASLPSA